MLELREQLGENLEDRSKGCSEGVWVQLAFLADVQCRARLDRGTLE